MNLESLKSYKIKVAHNCEILSFKLKFKFFGLKNTSQSKSNCRLLFNFKMPCMLFFMAELGFNVSHFCQVQNEEFTKLFGAFGLHVL